MFAITLDLDTEILKQKYRNLSYNNAHTNIRNFLTQRGFKWRQGSVYFGDPDKVNAVSTVLAAQGLSQAFAWFEPSVRDIRMLRILDDNDLSPVLTGATVLSYLADID
jgi:virulence-associated protein VapD